MLFVFRKTYIAQKKMFQIKAVDTNYVCLGYVMYKLLNDDSFLRKLISSA